VALSGSDSTGPFAYRGAGSFTIGSGTPDSTYVLPVSKYPNTRGSLTSSQAVWSVEFGTDAEQFQIRLNYQTAGYFRLSIDNRKVHDIMQPVGGTTPGSTHLMKINLGSAAPRLIRLDFYTAPFGGVFLPPTATMWSVPARGGRLMVFGDSISGGSSMNTAGGAGTWFGRLARMLGCTDAWNQSLGGTGYVTAGSFATLANRVAADVIGWSPDRLIVAAGYNDNGSDQTALGTAAASLYATIKAGLRARVLVPHRQPGVLHHQHRQHPQGGRSERRIPFHQFHHGLGVQRRRDSRHHPGALDHRHRPRRSHDGYRQCRHLRRVGCCAPHR
jgi:hypothetical protein